MRNDHYYLLAFNSTHYAIQSELILSKTLNVTVMPTLRSITASCGISIRIEFDDFLRASDIINSNIQIKNNSTLYEVLNGNPSKLDNFY